MEFAFLLLALAARAHGAWPECPPLRDACAAGKPYYHDGWHVRDYLVNGRRLTVSVSTREGALRLRCPRGENPLHPDMPKFLAEFTAHTIELTGCQLPSETFSLLLKSLKISRSVTDLSIRFDTNKPFDSNHLSGLLVTGLTLHSERLIKHTGPMYHYSNLKRLGLHRVSMSTEDFNFLTHIHELSLVENGLEEVPDLSLFKRLKRLEIRELTLSNASRLASAPALRDLTLEAPDAEMVSLPRLRNATFLNVYMMGRIFGDCSNLDRLSVVGGELDGLRAGWLAGCARLQRLTLTRLPRLRGLPLALLRDAVDLTHLDLSHNSLEALPTDLVQNVVNLKHLDLSFNRLKTLPDNLLASLNKYTSLFLDLSHFNST